MNWRIACVCFSMTHLLFLPMAHAGVLFCEAGAPSVPVLDPLSMSAPLGDFTLLCGGGDDTDPSPS